MFEYGAYVGLDVHKDTIAIAVAWPDWGEPEYRGILPNSRKSLNRLIDSLQPPTGEVLSFAYEAGPCGYGVYREITDTGHDCQVVAPTLIPRKPGDRVKTDRRDAVTLARLHRAGELTPVWVPGPDQEAVRDLTRAREDMKAAEMKARQRLGGFLLRHGRVYAGRSRWTQAHFRWLEGQKFALPLQQLVFQEYVDAAIAAAKRTDALVAQMHEMLTDWSQRPTAEALMSLRGISTITAMTVLAELGDLTRFDSPRELMGFVGLVPGEYSSGSRRRQGAITRTGNGHVRRLLIESAWAYRFPARKTAHLRRKGAKAPDRVQAIAWAAQKRLCGRYRKLYGRGMPKNKVVTAIARELVGFIWAIACEVRGRPHGTRAIA
ncbi:MAG: IS110 family transposase [Gammaproteobacteria bacterium]|nr:IS110 family transposase [Gammaproteobacteria bacterium]